MKTPAQRVRDAVNFYHAEHGRAAGFCEIAQRTGLRNDHLADLLTIMVGRRELIEHKNGHGGTFAPAMAPI